MYISGGTEMLYVDPVLLSTLVAISALIVDSCMLQTPDPMLPHQDDFLSQQRPGYHTGGEGKWGAPYGYSSPAKT